MFVNLNQLILYIYTYIYIYIYIYIYLYLLYIFCLGKVNFLIKLKVIRNKSNPPLKNN